MLWLERVSRNRIEVYNKFLPIQSCGYTRYTPNGIMDSNYITYKKSFFPITQSIFAPESWKLEAPEISARPLLWMVDPPQILKIGVGFLMRAELQSGDSFLVACAHMHPHHVDLVVFQLDAGVHSFSHELQGHISHSISLIEYWLQFYPFSHELQCLSVAFTLSVTHSC